MTTALAIKGDLDGSTVGHNQGIFKAAIGDIRDFLANLLGTAGTPDVAVSALKLIDSKAVLNLAPVPTIGASALTLTFRDAGGNSLSAANPAVIAQRSVTLGSGLTNMRTVTADFSMVVSSGSTLGLTSARLCPVYCYVIDNAGVEAAAVSGSFQGETGIFTTVAEGGAGTADTLATMYSTAVLTSKPGRLVAIMWFTLTAAGTWDSLPSEVKLAPFHIETVGEVVDYNGGVVPYGFHLQDGSNFSRTTYAKLFAKQGTAFGVGDGSTTFGVGDSRRRALVGAGGTGTGVLANTVGSSGGTETHTLLLVESPGHAHGGATGGQSADHTHPVGQPNQPGSLGSTGQSLAGNTAAATSSTSSNDHTHTIPSSGGDGPHNNMGPSLVVTKMVRWLGDI
jgi:microcystin-dependent protein